MQTGAITEYIDVAQITLYVFWIFFAALILYLRREDKREGYPLESDRSTHVRVEGFPKIPPAKEYLLAHGGTVLAPSEVADTRPVAAKPMAPWPGAPLRPSGDPMLDGVGPGAWAEREDAPDLTLEGAPRIVPMRVATDFWVEARDPDPRGMDVVGADGRVGGVVRDIWVDRSEPQVRYLELELKEGGGSVLLPITLARVDTRRGEVRVRTVTAAQLSRVPTTRQADQVTKLEEDKICAYYASGQLYALPQRQEALL